MQFSKEGCLLSQGQGNYHEYGQLAKFSAIFITYHVIMLCKVQACFGTALISMVFTCNLWRKHLKGQILLISAVG